MSKQALVRKEVFIFLVLVIASYAISVVLFLFLAPAPLANILGFLSLLCYVATILPSIVKTVFPASQKNNILRWLCKNRRQFGVAAFSFGLNHGVLLIIERHLSLPDPHTYIKYFQGVSTLLIFTLLAITSNDWSVRSLKSNWKKLHQLTYIAIFLLPWHILDKMGMQWTHLTPIAVLITIVTLILFIQRKNIEQIESICKQQINKQKANQQETKKLEKV